MTKKPKTQNAAEYVLLSEIRVKTRRGRRGLTKAERESLVQMFAVKASAQDFDVRSLAPRGSFLDRALRHFEDTDISYALPIMQVIMTAASMLTRRRSYVAYFVDGRPCWIWVVQNTRGRGNRQNCFSWNH